MSENKKSSGVSFLGLLGLMFIGLKLGGVIDWSWWWVTSPLWGVAVLLLILLFVAMWGVGLVSIVQALIRKFKE